MTSGVAKHICYICGSAQHIDIHHYDCKEGKISPETVPLCRRCHRTYHGLGLAWFDKEYLDKAIEVENKRRAIVGKPLFKREDVTRTDYWYKKHGIKRDVPLPTKDKVALALPTINLPRGEPLCGWQWVNDHLNDLDGWVPRIEIIHPELHFAMDIENAVSLKEAIKVLRGIKHGVRGTT